MCGIHAVISASEPCSLSRTIEACLRARGPDHLGHADTQVEQGDAPPLLLTFTSSVLSLRGDSVTQQPLVDDSTGSMLCWNGEAWKIGGQHVGGNDGDAILRLLTTASPLRDSPDAILEALRSIEGPFAFVFFHKPSRRLYYGRDRLGRRSLLSKMDDQSFTLSSIADSPATGWSEVEADGCYTVDLYELDTKLGLIPTRHEWTQDDTLVSSLGQSSAQNSRYLLHQVSGIGHFNANTPENSFMLTKQSSSVKQLREKLTSSLELRLLGVPLPPGASQTDARIAVLFSGGLDCTVLARMASDILPADQAIDLINVAFENPRIAAQHARGPPVNLYELCPDRITGRKSFAELLAICPQRRWRFVTVSEVDFFCMWCGPLLIDQR